MVLLAAGAAISWGASDFFGGALRRNLPVFVVVAVSQLLGLLVLAPILLVRGVPFPDDPHILFAAVAGLGVTLELRLVYLAISRGDAFVTAPVGALGAALAVAVGLLTGDRLTVPVAAGVLCALIGGLISAWSSPRRSGSLLSGAALCLGAAIGLATGFVCLHAAGRVDPYWAATVIDAATAIPAALAALAGARQGRPAIRAKPGHLALLAVPAAAGVAGDLAFLSASRHGSLSVVSAISSLYPLMTIALGMALQGRRSGPKEAVGLALALAGAVTLGAAAG
jgi:drug/metabolite transporter (DMT)-like permease